MTLGLRSKREHCPECDATAMHNFVLLRPGRDVAVFVECAACGAFVARYTLSDYTCDNPYRSFLRQMRLRRMDSGDAAGKAAEAFRKELYEDYRAAKVAVAAREETRDVEDLLGDLPPANPS